MEDEFERFCRAAVNEARQRCGGRRLVAALKPLLVDLVKRRCIESGLNHHVPPLSVTETNLDFPKEDIIEQKIMDC